MLSSALTQVGYSNHEVLSVKDTYEETKEIIKESLKKSDVVILSGGISVGDYDFVGKALIELGVKELFYKVKQKPGKPLFFGKLNNKYVFALPGNPAASLTSFYIYVNRALNRMTGLIDKEVITVSHLAEEYVKKGTRAQFLKAHVSNENVATILDGQSSAMLYSFAVANAIIYIPLDIDVVKKGAEVKTYLIHQ